MACASVNFEFVCVALGFRVLYFLDLVLGFLGLVFGIETWAWFVSVCNLGVAVGAVVVCCLNATLLDFWACDLLVVCNG